MENDEVLKVSSGIEEKPKRRTKNIPVRVIHTEGKSALVEWDDDGLRRAFVPVEEVDKDKCPASVLKAGVLYGVDWRKYIQVNVTVAEISHALHRAGFWTPTDIEQRVVRAQNVINQAVGISAAGLRRAAKNDLEE